MNFAKTYEGLQRHGSQHQSQKPAVNLTFQPLHQLIPPASQSGL
jgi:hypothetical protein